MGFRNIFIIIIFSMMYTFILYSLKPSYREDIAGASTKFNLAISLCGDLKIDGNEQCDLTNLNNQTCQSLGFASGDLFCRENCFFDLSQCINPTPTPTSIPTPTPSSTQTTPNPTPTSSSTQITPNPTPTSFDSSPDFSKIVPIFQPPFEFNLPSILKVTPSPDLAIGTINNFPVLVKYDHDQSGYIETNEISELIEVMVKQSQNSSQTNYSLDCDLNNDHICNVIDLSILMYYHRD